MACASGVNNRVSYVEVNIWLAKDKDGSTTTSSEGGRQHLQFPNTPARCGHASMKIFPENGDSNTYVSLWPGDPTAVLQNDISDDIESEKSLPDVIICLHNLNIPAMIAEFNSVKPRITKGEIKWELIVSDDKDITSPNNNVASCASFVYTFLKVGGLHKITDGYGLFVNNRGPKDLSYYRITKCNAGDRFWGIFNGAAWTRWVFSPKALLLRVAAASEAFEEDKKSTTEIMQSARVANEKTSVTMPAIAGLAAGAFGMLLLKK